MDTVRDVRVRVRGDAMVTFTHAAAAFEVGRAKSATAKARRGMPPRAEAGAERIRRAAAATPRNTHGGISSSAPQTRA